MTALVKSYTPRILQLRTRGHPENNECPHACSTTHKANLDEGAMWPIAFALTELTPAEEARIGALVEESGELRTE